MPDVKQYKCKYCGAELKYTADAKKFICEYCGGEFEESELSNPEDSKSQKDIEKEKEFEEGTNLYVCPSCGAEIISDANTAATFCYYCHEPVILKGRLSGEYRPSKVLPFEFGKEKAEKIFNDWSKKKWFTPKDFTSSKQMEKLTGLYVPFWVTDMDTSAHMDAIGKRIRTWSDGSYNYTETREYRVLRDALVKYDGLPADGSQKIEDALMEAIEPFDYEKTKDFSMAYLSGFLADKYDVDKKVVFPRIKKRMEVNNASILKSSAHYDAYISENISSNVNDVKWQYMLLPVWFMTYKYKGQMLEYAVNGQSGKIAGKLPVSYAKVAIFSTIVAAISGIIARFIGGIFS